MKGLQLERRHFFNLLHFSIFFFQKNKIYDGVFLFIGYYISHAVEKRV